MAKKTIKSLTIPLDGSYVACNATIGRCSPVFKHGGEMPHTSITGIDSIREGAGIDREVKIPSRSIDLMLIYLKPRNITGKTEMHCTLSGSTFSCNLR